MFRPLMSVLCSSTSLFVIAAAAPALAQDEPPDTPAAAAPALEVIKVTARRREEDLQKVPVAVSELTGAQIETLTIQSAQDLTRSIPALSNAQGGRDGAGFTLRGLSNYGANVLGLEANVAAYFSQVPYPTGDGGGPGRYYDLANVQVLKGAQGTLFGRNSTGGAVLFEPNHPADAYSGYASVEYGKYNDQTYEGMLNIPILPDELTIRVAGQRQERDGFTTNVINGQKLDSRDNWAGRVSLDWRPNETFDNYIVFDSYYTDTPGSSEELLGANSKFVLAELGSNGKPNGTACFVGVTLGGNNGPVPGCSAPFSLSVYPNPDLQNAMALQQQLGARQVASDLDAIAKTWSWGFTDIAALNLGSDTTLKNIFGYREYKNLTRIDSDGSDLPILQTTTPTGWNEDLAQYTNEVNGHAKLLDGKLDITAGNFFLFSHPTGQQTVISQQFTLPPAGQVQPLAEAGSNVSQILRSNTTSEALYAEAVYDLSHISDSLQDFKITAGYRYTWDHVSLNEVATRFGNPNAAHCFIRSNGANPAANCQIDVSGAFQAPAWTLGLEYQVDPQTLLYLTSRRGYRSGGVNSSVAEPSQFLFKPETVNDVELGFKNDWTLSGIKGRTDIALYHENIDNLQINQDFIDPQGSLIGLVNNSGSATINGVEFDTVLVPLHDVQVTGSWVYTKAVYDRFSLLGLGGVPIAINGSEPYPFTPLNRFSLDIRYFLPVPDSLGDVTIEATESYSTHTLLALGPDPFGMQPSYHQLDLHLDWTQIGGKPIDLSLFATNVYNSLYRVGGIADYNTIGYSTAVYNEPQMFGLKLKYRWGAAAQ
jgi:iron complex outermembrane receptor protein